METLTDFDARLSGCFQRVFPGLPAERIATATPDAVAEWDSIASISLVSVIEEEFNVLVDFEVLTGLESFGAIARYLRRLRRD